MPRPTRSTLFPYTTLFRSYRVGARHHFVVLIQCVGHRPRAAARDRARPGGVDAENGRIARRIRRLLNDQMAALRVRDLAGLRSEEHTSELQSRGHLVCRLL